MRHTWTAGLFGLVLAASMACGANDRAPDRDATQDAAGTTGRESGEITLTGCLALGQMGAYMLTTEGKAVTAKGYQLLGQPDDFNQYMNKRVRVTGTLSEEARERPDSDAPASARDNRETPWPKLQVREVDPVEGDCR